MKAHSTLSEKREAERGLQFPNRRGLRARGIGVGRGGYRPFGRLTRSKLTPASFETHVMLHHTSETGVVRKMRVPRDQVVRKDQA